MVAPLEVLHGPRACRGGGSRWGAADVKSAIIIELFSLFYQLSLDSAVRKRGRVVRTISRLSREKLEQCR